jgi:hypothetical protein
MIDGAETANPLNNLRDTGNPDGAILGYAATPDNLGPTRIGSWTPGG